MATDPQRPVLILGAGINGCALARELVLNGVPVRIVDREDVAAGATSRSSRLIHGGLRYLEYGDFGLVRESLEERSRLLATARPFVAPLRLFIPVAARTGGLITAARRFLGGITGLRGGGSAPGGTSDGRGLWAARIGLALYDGLARATQHSTSAPLPSHTVHELTEPHVPHVDPARYAWLCAYSDARMEWPERFVLALLADAAQVARESALEFAVRTRAVAEPCGERVRIVARDETGAGQAPGDAVDEFAPALIVNATGAWGDRTLAGLGLPESPRLFGGTKGSHFVSFDPQLRRTLGDDGLYAETSDGRLVFVLPFDTGTLVGTTDLPFDAPPETAVAAEVEIAYLVRLVREVFPGLRDFDASRIALHYSGVRPLPAADRDAPPGAVSRGHWVVEGHVGPIPLLTLVGGKLTTGRAFGEVVADAVLERLGRPRRTGTRNRSVPGAVPAGWSEAEAAAWRTRAAQDLGLTQASVEALWPLVGMRIPEVVRVGRELLAEDAVRRAGSAPPAPDAVVFGTDLPLAFVRWSASHEWVGSLDGLVERRSMLLFHPRLSRRALTEVAAVLVAARRIDGPGEPDRDEVAAHVDRTIARLVAVYGRHVGE